MPVIVQKSVQLTDDWQLIYNSAGRNESASPELFLRHFRFPEVEDIDLSMDDSLEIVESYLKEIRG